MNAYKKYMAEFVGTFALVFIAAGSVCADFYLRQAGGQGLGLLGISIAFGVVVIAVIYATSYVSGSHVNPAVTVSFWITKRMEPNTAIMYIISQIAGASLAGLALKTLFPDAAKTVYLGTCMLAPGVSIARGVLMEFIITFLLIFTIYGTLVDKKGFGWICRSSSWIGGTLWSNDWRYDQRRCDEPRPCVWSCSCIRTVHSSFCLVVRSDPGRNCSGSCL